jgi:hypothetical protein
MPQHEIFTMLQLKLTTTRRGKVELLSESAMQWDYCPRARLESIEWFGVIAANFAEAKAKNVSLCLRFGDDTKRALGAKDSRARAFGDSADA